MAKGAAAKKNAKNKELKAEKTPVVICPNCSAKVEKSLMACPQCGLSRMANAEGFGRRLAKIALIPFNVFMLIWLLSALHVFSRAMGFEGDPDATQSISNLEILIVWIIGDALLAYLFFANKKKR